MGPLLHTKAIYLSYITPGDKIYNRNSFKQPLNTNNTALNCVPYKQSVFKTTCGGFG